MICKSELSKRFSLTCRLENRPWRRWKLEGKTGGLFGTPAGSEKAPVDHVLDRFVLMTINQFLQQLLVRKRFSASSDQEQRQTGCRSFESWICAGCHQPRLSLLAQHPFPG